MNWQNYFYNQFPQDLRKFDLSREHKDCPHHQIPRHLAWFVDEFKDYKFGPEFYMSWFGLSMIDQVLNKYFEDAFQKWKQKFGEHPIPMRGSGLGCIIWDNPIWLVEKFVDLKSEQNLKKFDEFIDFLLSITRHELNKIGLGLDDFLLAVLRDKRVLNRNSPACDILINRFESKRD